MQSYCTDYLATLPDITVYINCDTRLAINLRAFGLGDNDEFIFAIKNYDYIDSPYVFLFRARKSDLDENGEVIFKIPPADSKYLKPGAFYNFAVLLNVFDYNKETEYRKLTDNGKVILKYGAQDLLLHSEIENSVNAHTKYEILGARLELLDESTSSRPNDFINGITGMHLEYIPET